MDRDRHLIEHTEGIAGLGKLRRDFDVKVGGQYVFEPLNPRAMKNRGRTCEVIEIVDARSKSNDAGCAIVKWLDTKRRGTVDVGSLIAMKE